jgi:hypothetical protein
MDNVHKKPGVYVLMDQKYLGNRFEREDGLIKIFYNDSLLAILPALTVRDIRIADSLEDFRGE